jgi:FAD binding domain in molybdopterin dehydrogenase
MRPFRYEKAPDVATAVQFFAQGTQAKYLGGGTNLVDLMRENIERPEIVIDVTGLSREISDAEDGGRACPRRRHSHRTSRSCTKFHNQHHRQYGRQLQQYDHDGDSGSRSGRQLDHNDSHAAGLLGRNDDHQIHHHDQLRAPAGHSRNFGVSGPVR